MTFSTVDGSPLSDGAIGAIEGLGSSLVEAGGSSGVFTLVANSDQVLSGAPVKLGDQVVVLQRVEEV